MNSQHVKNIQGSIVALVTPMFEDDSIDWESLRQLVEWHIQQGTHSIVAVGTTGEASTLDMQEHTQVISEIIQVAAGRIPIIAGTGANSTSEAIELTQEAKKLGADAALLVSPYYNKPTQEGLYQHHKKIAETVDIPQILYNVPGRTGVDLLNDTAVRLSEVPGIIGIKDATGDIPRGTELIQRLAGKMAVYSGDDATAWQLILAGARGNISVTANVVPHIMSQVCEAALAGNASLAQQLNHRVETLHSVLFCEANPIPVKWALYDMGKIPLGIRLPLTALAQQYHSSLHTTLVQTGAISA